MNVKWTYEELNDVVQSCVEATNEYVFLYARRLCRSFFLKWFWNVNIAMLFINETYWRTERVKHTIVKNILMKIMFLYYTIFYSVEICLFVQNQLVKGHILFHPQNIFLCWLSFFAKKQMYIYIYVCIFIYCSTCIPTLSCRLRNFGSKDKSATAGWGIGAGMWKSTGWTTTLVFQMPAQKVFWVGFLDPNISSQSVWKPRDVHVWLLAPSSCDRKFWDMLILLIFFVGCKFPAPSKYLLWNSTSWEDLRFFSSTACENLLDFVPDSNLRLLPQNCPELRPHKTNMTMEHHH